MSERRQEPDYVSLYRLAAWLTEGADEHEDGNGAVDLPGRARTAAETLRDIAYKAQHATATPEPYCNHDPAAIDDAGVCECGQAVSIHHEEDADPGQGGVLLTRNQINGWAALGRDLTDAELDRLADAIPHSSIPDAIDTIVSEALRLRYETCDECGAALDDGEGYDGLCGNCADRDEEETAK